MIEKVIKGGYCIGCGACAAFNDDYKIRENELGLYEASFPQTGHDNAASEVCPFSSEHNEDQISGTLFKEESHFDKRIGNYKEIFAGHVVENSFRSEGSSGGLVTWVLIELLRLKMIDGVIHVGSSGESNQLFKYVISETAAEIKANSKSRYYPVHFDKVIHEIRNNNKRYAFVGVPCFVKAMRLLMENDQEINNRIKFCIAIFCGHLKSKAFAEMVGWQQNIEPRYLAGINFRVKDNKRPPSHYSVQVTKRISTQECIQYEPILARELFGMDWGVGFFRPKACDWCDDIAGEVADLACGDAWLPEFAGDSGGTNITVVRNKDIQQILSAGITLSKLKIKSQTADDVYQSQEGNYRHRQEGLSMRISSAESKGLWHPKKRITKNTFSISHDRQNIYHLRSKISETSHRAFLQAKKNNNFLYFMAKMTPMELHYAFLNKRLLKGFLKTTYYFIRYFQRKYK